MSGTDFFKTKLYLVPGSGHLGVPGAGAPASCGISLGFPAGDLQALVLSLTLKRPPPLPRRAPSFLLPGPIPTWRLSGGPEGPQPALMQHGPGWGRGGNQVMLSERSTWPPRQTP